MGSSSTLPPPPPPLSRVCSSSPCLLSDKNHGRSKAQMCLKKILDFISTSKPHEQHRSLEFQSQVEGRKGFDIDLNLRLGSFLESENDGGFSSACSGVGEEVEDGVGKGVNVISTLDNKSSLGECDPNLVHVEDEPEVERVVAIVEEEEEGETKEEESSEITEIEDTNNEEDGHESKMENEDSKFKLVRKSEGYLDLLVEAARLVSGDFKDGGNEMKEKEPSENHEATKNWMVECFGGFEEDISPIVRSKRGRNQVLPLKYRDSVLEPWNRLTRPRSSNITSTSRVRKRRSKPH